MLRVWSTSKLEGGTAAREHAIIGDPCWVDLMTTGTNGARNFYSRVFGWDAGEPSEEFGGYFMFMREGVPIAGAMANPPGSEIPPVWSTYLAVKSAEETLALGEAAGATVVAPAMQITDLGTMAVMLDPTGAAIGIWAPIEFQGFGVIDEVGPHRWFELHSRDHDRAVDFYRNVFSWDTRAMSDEPALRYTTVNHADQSFAGIMDDADHLAQGVAGYWLVYFGVEDVDATVALVKQLGGSVLSPPQDTPFGRMATLADTTGAMFTVMQS
jgi:predicted enzyme related to lactoylglutathione lyase